MPFGLVANELTSQRRYAVPLSRLPSQANNRRFQANPPENPPSL